jgi:geranylgeranyl reductase family protein
LYDVVISGGGPAGSKCAEFIAHKGYKVALIERDSHWRKPCGGAVSSRIFKYYPQLRKQNYFPITGMTIYSADYHKIKYSWKGVRDYSINVDRLEFDTFLRNIAIDAGAELFDKHLSIDFIIKNHQKIGIKTKTATGLKEFLGKIIIIADGMSSKLAVKPGLRHKWNINEIGLVKCAILEGENNLDKASLSMFFRPYKGYGWIFPLGENRFNIGCGTWQEENLNYNVNNIYAEFLKEPFLRQILSSQTYKTIWEGAYPIPAVGVRDASLYQENVMIVGDAAGFVSPISGEGIHPSIVSGNAAAETAVAALEGNNITSSSLKKYKMHPNIKAMTRNFKMKLSLVDFFFENKGNNLSKMLKLAEQHDQYREEVINMFLFNQTPSPTFLAMIKSKNSI